MRRFARTFATLLRRHRCSQRAIAIRTGWVLQAALLAATTLCAGSAARAAGFDQFIGFGDSTMDSGYFRYGQTGGLFQLGGASARAVDAGIKSAVAAGVSGAFVGPGVMNTSSLAARFGLTAVPVTFPAGARTNHGNGSAQTVSTTQGDGYLNGFLNNVPTVVPSSCSISTNT
jgi:outer membrane lipase/esterase